MKAKSTRRRQRGGATVEAALVALCMAFLLAILIMVSGKYKAKLDATYASRDMAFDHALHGCVEGQKTVVQSLDDLAKAPPSDPQAEKLASQDSGQGVSVTQFMEMSEASVGISTGGVTMGSRSAVGCVENNHGTKLYDEQDPSAIPGQLSATVGWVWSNVQAWLGLHL